MYLKCNFKQFKSKCIIEIYETVENAIVLLNYIVVCVT